MTDLWFETDREDDFRIYGSNRVTGTWGTRYKPRATRSRWRENAAAAAQRA
ncbi:MAG: hypothetical protein LBI84_09600 [Propionibacteriaceae bacterium]|nr:hypothetical protein [Propionibacteriaceae bacterium]